VKGSFERARKLLSGAKPDHIPVYDILPNDEILRHFNGAVPVEAGEDEIAVAAIRAATDSTRVSSFSPQKPRTEILPDGRKVKYERWTTWTEHKVFSSSCEYAEFKRKEISNGWKKLDNFLGTANDPWYKMQIENQKLFGDDFSFVLSVPMPGLMRVYDEIGLEAFSYYLADCEEIISAQLDLYTAQAAKWIDNIPQNDPCEMVFAGEDIAFNNGPMFSPEWLAREFFPRLKILTDKLHSKGKKVMYHSDGNINLLMDMIVESGADILNPIDVNAGMDLKKLHAKYPRLYYAGGIDVTHLLPNGKPQEIKDTVTKAIEDTEGRIFIGSSTEVANNVPLENFLAMRDAAMNFTL
jgi:hypothetical protein